MKKNIKRFLIDFVIQAVFLKIAIDFSMTQLSSKYLFKFFIPVAVLCALLSSVLFVIIIKKEKSIKYKRLICLLSGCSTLLNVLIWPLITIIIPFSFFPQRISIDNVDGLLGVFAMIFYVVIALLFRLFVFLFFCFRKQKLTCTTKINHENSIE